MMEEQEETKSLVDLVRARIEEHSECITRSDVANSRKLALELELSLVYEALQPIVGKKEPAPAPKPRRTMSAAARLRISEGQKKRWEIKRGNSGLGPIKDSSGNVVAKDFGQRVAAE